MMQVVFNAIGFKDMAKHQLTSFIKKHGLKPAKEAQNVDKERAAQIANVSYLLDNEIVQSNNYSAKELKKVIGQATQPRSQLIKSHITNIDSVTILLMKYALSTYHLNIFL